MRIQGIVLFAWIQVSLSAKFSCSLTGIRAVSEAHSGANHITFTSNGQTFQFNGNISEAEFAPILISNFTLHGPTSNLSFQYSTDYESSSAFLFRPKCLQFHTDCYELFRFGSYSLPCRTPSTWLLFRLFSARQPVLLNWTQFVGRGYLLEGTELDHPEGPPTLPGCAATVQLSPSSLFCYTNSSLTEVAYVNVLSLVPDSCNRLVCPANQVCLNDTRPFCECESGFAQLIADDPQCYDLNECQGPGAAQLCPAGRACHNTFGSYACDPCAFGWTPNGTHCTDNDECEAGADNCFEPFVCRNTPGSFVCVEPCNPCDAYPCQPPYVCQLNPTRCVCPDGYKGVNCTEVDPCNSERCPDPSQKCILSFGSWWCVCGDGYELATTFSCADINECMTPNATNCLANASCVNTPGSYRCQCPPGYWGDGRTPCRDVNECYVAGSCPADRLCINTLGSYRCVCPPNTTEQGGLCVVPAPTCADTRCGRFGVCSEASGSPVCACLPGYSGDGYDCRLVTCLDGLTCPAQATCDPITLTDCLCQPGYRKSGSLCVDVDECSDTARCGPYNDCRNTPSSWNCSCPPGLAGGPQLCLDVDECNLSPPRCQPATELCVNRWASYVCVLRPLPANDSSSSTAEVSLPPGATSPAPSPGRVTTSNAGSLASGAASASETGLSLFEMVLVVTVVSLFSCAVTACAIACIVMWCSNRKAVLNIEYGPESIEEGDEYDEEESAPESLYPDMD